MNHPRIITFVLFVAGALGFWPYFIHAQAGNTDTPKPSSAPSSNEVTIYDADPKHLWNRLQAAIFVRELPDGRTFGTDELDPLLFDSTTHLLVGPSYDQAIAVLDEFLSSHGERLIADPLKRAVLQYDLWAVFDWGAIRPRLGLREPNLHLEDQSKQLCKRLAEVIRRLALTRAQIEAIPDNFSEAVKSHSSPTTFDANNPEQPFLPDNLFDEKGPWVLLGRDAAPVHTASFGDRSAFLVFLKLSNVRATTLEYLSELSAIHQPFIEGEEPRPTVSGTGGGNSGIILGPNVPQLPVGTQVALVRQALLIDTDGDVVPSHLTESVQLRVYRKISLDFDAQSPFEWTMTRARLFAGQSGGLRAFGQNGYTVLTRSVNPTSYDPMEIRVPRPPIDLPKSLAVKCYVCHYPAGISSLASYHSFMRQDGIPPGLVPSLIENEQGFVTNTKHSQFEWGLFKGLGE